MNIDHIPCLDIGCSDNTASPNPNAVQTGTTAAIPSVIKVIPPEIPSQPFCIPMPEIPPMPPFSIIPPITLNFEEIVANAGVQQVRNLINAMIAVRCVRKGWLAPIYLGCPPSEYLAQVEHEVISFLAETEWQQADCPTGRDVEFWLLGEARYKKAFHYWI